MFVVPTNFLRRMVVACSIASILLPTKIFAGVIATLNDSANDAGNHRMEQAIAIGDSVFETSSQDDFVSVTLGNNGLASTSTPDHGEAIRAYLYKDVIYVASVGSYQTLGGSRVYDSTAAMDDSVLTMVAGASGTGSNTFGLATAASGFDFDYGANNYKVVASNDDSISATPGGAAFMSELQFTVGQTGYHYFYVSQWNGGGDSSAADAAAGYASTGGNAANTDANGSFNTPSTSLVPTGSVSGGIPAPSTTTFYLLHLFGDTPNSGSTTGGDSVVPEPSTLAIFGILGIAAFNRTRRSKKSESKEI